MPNLILNAVPPFLEARDEPVGYFNWKHGSKSHIIDFGSRKAIIIMIVWT